MTRGVLFAVAPLAIAAFAGCITNDLGGDLKGGVGTLVQRVVPDLPTQIASQKIRERESGAAIDPTNPMHYAVLYNERPDNLALDPAGQGALTVLWTPQLIVQALATSHNGGATWVRQEVPTTGKAPPTSKWNAFCAMGDPGVFFDKEGIIHIVTIALSCGGPGLTTVNGIVHATTRDDGKTWSEPDYAWVVPGGIAVTFNDREWAAYDAKTGRIGVAWSAIQLGAQRTVLTAVFSSDGGKTWTLPEEIDARLVMDTNNWLLHTTWGGDGLFHITGSDCPTGLLVGDGSLGGCVSHYRGPPGGPWARVTIPKSDCAGLPDHSLYWYQSSVADFKTGRLFIGADVIGDLDGPGGTYNPVNGCLFASPDNGATWSKGIRVADKATHVWVALTPDGMLAASYLEVLGDQVVPKMTLYDPVTLAAQETVVLGPVYDPDANNDGYYEYGDYDELSATGGRFVWSVTHPTADSMPSGPVNLDMRGYRGTFVVPTPASLEAKV